MDEEQRAKTQDDRPPDLGGMSLAEVGLALKPHLLDTRSDPAASVVKFVLRHSGLERGGNIERHSPLSALVLPHSGRNIALVGGRKGSTWPGRRGGGGT